MAVTPGSLGRRYAPFLAIAAVQVLLVAIVPSRDASHNQDLSAGAGNGTYAATAGAGGAGAAGGAAGGADGGAGGVAGGAGSVSAGGAGSTGGAAGTAAGGGTAGAAGTSGAALDRSRCDASGHQIGPTYYMPLCAPAWKGGDNGGSTMTGVTGTEIRYMYYATKPDPQVNAVLATQGLAASKHDQCAAYDAFNRELNKRYEFYGRKLVPVDGPGNHKGSTQDGCDSHYPHYQGQCPLTPPDPPCERAEAAQIASMKPAMVIASAAPSSALSNELTKRGIIYAGGTQWQPAEYHAATAPYFYDVFMDGTRSAHIVAEYWCKKLYNKPVKYAGDDVMHPTPGSQPPIRKLGISYPSTKGDPTYKIGVDALVKDVTGGMCGTSKDAPVVRSYESDITTAQSQSQTAATAFKSAHVTTLICMCDPIAPAFATTAMDQQNYHPEHLLSGTGLIDYDVLGRLYSPSQWQHAFGPSQLYNFPSFDQTDAAKAWRDAGNSGLPDATENLAWGYFSLVGGAFQMAGPNPTPANIRNGLFRAPPRGGWKESKGDPSKPLLKFGNGPDDYTGLEDIREVFWSSTARSTIDGKPGAYVPVDGGHRYTFGEIPPGDPKVFQ